MLVMDVSLFAPEQTIRSVEPVLIAVPFEQGARKRPSTALVDWSRVNILFVRVETQDGLVGWGEAFAITAANVTMQAVREIVARIAVGRSFSDPQALSDDLRRAANTVARGGGPVAFALSGLDIALWDIAGQAARKPVWQMLGGVGRTHIPAYASLFRLTSPAEVETVCAAAVARGFQAIKLHEASAGAVAAGRRGAGQATDLMVDVNAHWSDIKEALAFARAIEPERIAWLEEPLYPSDDYALHARFRRAMNIPLALGENLGNVADVHAALAAHCVDVLQPSVAKIGGITAVWRAAQAAEAAGVRFVPHSPFHGPGLAAAVHVAAALTDEIACELRYCDLAAQPLVDFGEAHEGRLRVPDAPGLGIIVDPAVIERFRIG
jgi:D-galactarolactone cycloisomerase